MAHKYKGSSWEDLDLTRDEVEQLGTALKKEEFRKLLLEYVEEINDPENKKQYEKEITELEKERGIDVIFINPEPCYVIKSSVDGQKKAFINICKNDKVGKPTSVPGTKSGTRGLNWSLPYTQAPPRDDLDKNGNRCTVFDVVFHPDTHHLAENNAEFKKMLNNTALDAVENNFNVQLDRTNLKFPKLKYKGSPQPTVIRRKIENAPHISRDEFSIPESVYPYKPPMEETELCKINDKVPVTKRSQVKDEDSDTSSSKIHYTTPKYVIKHRRPIDIQDFSNDRDAKLNTTIPKELVIEIQLPLLRSSADMVLDVTQKSISLKSEKPAKYKLDLTLPYTVDEETGTAKFDQKMRKLVITLPVRCNPDIHLMDIGREDSGVESDLGHRTPDSSSDEENVSNQNSIIEIPKNEISLPQISSDDAYRTISRPTSDRPIFLNPDIHYLLPPFTCNVVDSIMAFTVHVKNVDPDSIEHSFIGQEFCGVHLRFTSIGSGFFPIHYAFCLKFPSWSSIIQESFGAEAWDNNVIVQMQLKSCDTSVMEYYAGVDENSLVKYDLPEPAAISRKLEQLKIEALDNATDTDLKIEVTKYTESEVTIEICPDQASLKQDEDSASNNNDHIVDSNANDASSPYCASTSSDNELNGESISLLPGGQKSPHKYRTMSESSGDELSFSPTKKGILKNNGRVCRSLSESSMDDYAWSSSLDMVTQSGSESCIPEEATDEERETKKTVRFNEVVSKKTYRTNSSILGQRKKNQRKTRNKKRCQERRASESENSEGEAEREREREAEREQERERKTDDETDKSDTGSEDKLSNSSGSGDEAVIKDAIPTVQEIWEPDEAGESPIMPSSAESQQSGSGDHEPCNGGSAKYSPNKGKKKNLKGVGALQGNAHRVTQVEFGNDLIFDLDM